RFETKQDLLRKRARLAKRDEVGATFALQVRKHTARMESGDEMVRALCVRHGCSAGVPACEFWRRPAASWNVWIHRCLCSLHRDGAGTRSRGRLRYMGGVPPPALGTCTGTVRELAAEDGCATLPRQLIDLAIDALFLGP